MGCPTLLVLGSAGRIRPVAAGGGLKKQTFNVRAKLPAEAGVVSPVRENSTAGADRAYNACRSGSA